MAQRYYGSGYYIWGDAGPTSTAFIEALCNDVHLDSEIYILGKVMGVPIKKIQDEIDWHECRELEGLEPEPMQGILHGLWCHRARGVNVPGTIEAYSQERRMKDKYAERYPFVCPTCAGHYHRIAAFNRHTCSCSTALIELSAMSSHPDAYSRTVTPLLGTQQLHSAVRTASLRHQEGHLRRQEEQ